jgi:NitT/TauT family transport system substrate-binding protein
MAFLSSLRAAFVLSGVLVASPALAHDIVVSQWGVSLAGSAYAVALDQGLFKNEGVVTGVVASQGGGAAIRTVLATDDIDTLGFGLVSLSAAVEAIRRGADIKIVSVEARTAGDIFLITSKDSSVNTIRDLKGKSIGITTPFGFSDMISALAVTQAGLPLESVKRVALGSVAGGLTALDTGAIAATHILDPQWQLKKADYKLLVAGRDLPPAVQAVGVATKSLIRDHPDMLRAILVGRKRAVLSIKADPGRAAKSMVKYYERYSPEVMETVLRSLMSPPTQFFNDNGEFEIPALDNTLDGLRLIGGFKGDVEWSQMLDASFQPKP